MSVPPRSNGVERSMQEEWGGIERSENTCLELAMPARPELWSLVRMAVGSVAVTVGYDFEVVADLKLALDELCNTCAVGANASSTLRLGCHWSEIGLYVECSVAPVTEEPQAAEDDELPAGMSQRELSESILAALVDAYRIAPVESGSRRGWLRKRLG